MPGHLVYCYPNPAAADDVVHVRFFLNRAADINLDIFDAVGRHVDSVQLGSESMQVPAENEITFATADLASGLYLCQLEASAIDGGMSRSVVKMAVSR